MSEKVQIFCTSIPSSIQNGGTESVILVVT